MHRWHTDDIISSLCSFQGCVIEKHSQVQPASMANLSLWRWRSMPYTEEPITFNKEKYSCFCSDDYLLNARLNRLVCNRNVQHNYSEPSFFLSSPKPQRYSNYSQSSCKQVKSTVSVSCRTAHQFIDRKARRRYRELFLRESRVTDV